MSKKIGLFGYGAVGQGFVHALTQNEQLVVKIARICVKDANKPRNLPASLFTTDPKDILQDPEIDIVVELIDDSVASYEIVEEALKRNKGAISANKKMIAENIREVATWHQKYRPPFLYEAAVAGAIPIIHNIEQNFCHQKILSLRGILNGSTNYILTQMRAHQLSYEEALRQAQENGFAESDPTLDISGQDALYKLIILGYHAFGLFIDREDVRVESITNMEEHFYDLAAQRGEKIKSIASIYESNGKFRFKVQPELVNPSDELFCIENEFNAVVIEGNLSGEQCFVGKGAGSIPTGSAVLNDLSLLLSDFRYKRRNNTLSMRKSA